MKNGMLVGAALMAAAAVTWPAAGLAQDAGREHQSGLPTGRYIFVLKDGFTGDAAAKGRSIAAINPARLGAAYGAALRGFTLETTAETAGRIAAATPEVAYVEPDLTVSLYDSFTPGPVSPQAYDDMPQVIPWGIARVGGCAKGSCDVPARVRNGRVWVLDTGIADHPDLVIDRARGFSSVGEGGYDLHGHGTHVSGTIAAKNDAHGVVGVAPGITVVPVQVISSQNVGSVATIIAGIDHVVQQRLQCARTIGCEPQKWVVNMSLTLPASRALDRAVTKAAGLGIRFAIAAGNQGEPASQFSPARANGLNVFTVSASCGPVMPECAGGKDYIASFSNYGNPPVDYAAPGDEVLSTFLGGGYAAGAGTSMATPHVAGLLARLPGLNTLNARNYFCGTLKGDPDGRPDPIAFLYGPRDIACRQALAAELQPPR